MVLVLVVVAFAEMPSDVDSIADVIASALAADHIQFFSISAVKARGMYKQRIRTAWDHAANRGWTRLLVDRRRDLIDQGPRTTCRVSGKTGDEEQQWHDDYHFHCPEHFHTCASD